MLSIVFLQSGITWTARICESLVSCRYLTSSVYVRLHYVTFVSDFWSALICHYIFNLVDFVDLILFLILV